MQPARCTQKIFFDAFQLWPIFVTIQINKPPITYRASGKELKLIGAQMEKKRRWGPGWLTLPGHSKINKYRHRWLSQRPFAGIFVNRDTFEAYDIVLSDM